VSIFLTSLQSLWLGFSQTGNTYASVSYKGFVKEVQDMIKMFNSDEYLNNPVVYDGVTKKLSQTNKKAKPFVHLFNTTGILQHNDIGPQWHPVSARLERVSLYVSPSQMRT